MNNNEECCISKTSEHFEIMKKTETQFPRITKNKSSIIWLCKK